ncbi:CD225/dispanin family protein [Spiractinospora alimapuensis]|uniref:CD225/dispanin family protein n=1 Tax=Spiractinospora alimapuensis TaxID=2820884 RepID=UPI001F26B62E|nr:CD225/dispanin family protein [Spiractinospora alimapuensis]QVQ51808.1 CD225/dispanin family protein [Spiractinospora alimapuensis]
MSHPQAGPPPSNWMVPAILSVICCWPLAIPSIIFAARVNKQWAVGDYAGAHESARKAKMFTIITLVVGIIAGTVALVVNLAML